MRGTCKRFHPQGTAGFTPTLLTAALLSAQIRKGAKEFRKFEAINRQKSTEISPNHSV